ncbi:MAG: TraB/GumN family protein [Saprospiraceae bacterium]
MKANKKTLLWEISGGALPGKSYIFGTMHVKDARVFQRLGKVYAAMAQCEAYAAEFDLQDAGEGVDPRLFALPEDLSLDQLIPAKKYDKLRRVLKKTLHLNIDLLKYNRPLLLSNLIEERLLASNMPESLDEHLWQYAYRLGKHRFGIETLQEQLKILQLIPIQHQIQSLLSTVRHFSRYRHHLLKMAQWYEQGDIYKLYQSTRRGTHSLRGLLLYDRNVLMANRIAQLIQQQATFCSIGAAHLAGQRGVLRLLKLQGFHLRPLPL